MSKYRPAFVFLVVVILLMGANFLFTAHEVNASQQRWCTTLRTLNAADAAAEKAPPAQRPKGAYSFALIKDFKELQRSLGCS